MTDGKGTILVVDDEEDSLSLVTEILTQDGYDVRVAKSGEQALASVEVQLPELILLEIRLRDMDGFELCRRLKAGLNTCDVPIVFISATTSVEEHAECFRVGAIEFISKPLVREELLARVRAHLELGRLRRRLVQQVSDRTAALEAAHQRVQYELLERRHAERALRESEERFRNMADTAPVMIWVLGIDKSFTFVNRQWLQFRGRTLVQERGTGLIEGVHPDDCECLVSSYEAAFGKRQKFQMEYRLARADGEYRWMMTTGLPRFTSNGEFTGYIGSCIDITDLKRSHEERLAAQNMERLGALAAGIAHDFNNLLGSILAESDLALSAADADCSSREHIERISAVAVRASEIVDLLMIYAGSNQRPATEPADISGLVDDILHLLEPSLPKQAKLHRQLANGLPYICTYAPQMRRVVINLIKNASEALEGCPGSITVSTQLEHLSRNQASNVSSKLPDGDYVRLSVSDTGHGMTSESVAKAFDPFYTTKFPGRGLGLAVVQGIVQAHGGSVQVSSQLGSGTTIDVLLPCVRSAETVRRPSTRRSAQPSVRGTKILLVEDEETLRDAITKALQTYGFEIVAASSGEAALQLLEAHEVDCVVLDLMLPGMSGTEVQRAMLQMKPNLAIVLTSAYDLASRKDFASHMPAGVAFLRKPFRVNQLMSVLNEVLSSRKERQDAAAQPQTTQPNLR